MVYLGDSNGVRSSRRSSRMRQAVREISLTSVLVFCFVCLFVFHGESSSVVATSSTKSTDALLSEMQSLMARHTERMRKDKQTAKEKTAGDNTLFVGGRFAETKASLKKAQTTKRLMTSAESKSYEAMENQMQQQMFQQAPAQGTPPATLPGSKQQPQQQVPGNNMRFGGQQRPGGNAGMMNPGMMNPGMMNPGMMNPGMMNPGMMNPGMMNPMMGMMMNNMRYGGGGGHMNVGGPAGYFPPPSMSQMKLVQERMREQNALYRMQNPVNMNGKGVPSQEKPHAGATNDNSHQSAKSVMESMYEQKKPNVASNGVSQIMQSEGTPMHGNGDIPPPPSAGGKSVASKADAVPPPTMLLQESMRQNPVHFRDNAPASRIRAPKPSAYRKKRGLSGILSKIRNQEWGNHKVTPLLQSFQNAQPTVLLQERSTNNGWSANRNAETAGRKGENRFTAEDYGYGPVNRQVREAGSKQRFESTGSKLVDGQSMYISNPQVRKELEWEKSQKDKAASDPLESEALKFDQRQQQQQQPQPQQIPKLNGVFELARFKEQRDNHAELQEKLHRKELENQLLKIKLERLRINQAAEQERAKLEAAETTGAQEERFRAKAEGLVEGEQDYSASDGEESAADVSPTSSSFKSKAKSTVVHSTVDQDMVLPSSQGLDKKPTGTFEAPSYDNSKPLAKDKSDKGVLSVQEKASHKSHSKNKLKQAAKQRFMERMAALHKVQKQKPVKHLKWHSWVSKAKAAARARYPAVERN